MGPLTGTRVLDLSRYGTGRYCTMILGDLGADVIAIEAPRESMELHSVMTEDTSFRHLGMNRNKKSMAIDLKQQEGRDVFYQLAKRADVIVETFRPGVVKRLEVDYDTVRAMNPRIVYCSITGYGQTGPYSQRPGHDINFAGIAGVLSLTGSNQGTPAHLPFQVGDIAGISLATSSILAALLARERTGKGQHIDASMVDSLVFHLWHYAMMYFTSGEVPSPPQLPTGSDMAWMNIYRTRDDRYLTLACIEPRLWANLCRAVGREDLLDDQFTPPERQKDLYEELSMVFASRDRDEWTGLADTHDVPVAPVYTLDEVFADLHLKMRDAVVTVDHPKLGEIQLLNTPFKLSGTPAEVRTRPPLWAEHTRTVLRDDLGYSDREIEALLRQRAVE